MVLEIKLSQKLTQSLVITPQLQQAIRMLQLGRLDYVDEINKEILGNPLLEISENREQVGFFGQDDVNGVKFDTSTLDSVVGSDIFSETSLSRLSRAVENISYDRGLEEISSLQNSYMSEKARKHFDVETYSFENIVSNSEGLEEHIIKQLNFAALELGDGHIVECILGNLNRDGYLTCSTEDISRICSANLPRVEFVLSVIQHTDPSGIGARDLKECLLIQLKEIGLYDRLPGRLLIEYSDLLEKRRYDLIAKNEQCAIDVVYEAVREISKLDPYPGRSFFDDAPSYVIPDVYVKKIGDDYTVYLNDDGVPRLKISSNYSDLLSNSPNGVDRAYVQECFKRGQWFMRAIDQRQATICKVTKSIISHQRDFLDNGVEYLRPLVLREVAQDVNLHESTVSRATSNKYVHTPQGIFELKFFFTSALSGVNGEVSSESVKSKLREMICKEDPKFPLSDQAIVDILKEEGVEIARRTVAKYRDMLNIPSSSSRRKFF